MDPATTQAKVLDRLLRKAQETKFGRDHSFTKIRNVETFQSAVPLRNYESFWNEYWKNAYPVLKDVTWPGTVPFFALSSGTTSGTTKYIPITHEMIRSNTKAGLDMLSFHVLRSSSSALFGGMNFMLGGSTELNEVSQGIFAGDLSGIAVKTLPWYIEKRYFPPKELALLKNWEEKIEILANASLKTDIRMISGVPSWLLIFFEKLFSITGKKTLKEVYPNLELLVHGGVNFTPYRQTFLDIIGSTTIDLREVYPASEGFIASADRGFGEGLRLNTDNDIFFEFVPLSELASDRPTRHWVKTIEPDINYAIVLSSCSGLWSYVLGDTVKFVDVRNPRLLITGRTSYSLSAFGEHLIAEEIEKALQLACQKTDVSINEYSVGALYPEKPGDLGGHLYIVELSKGLLNSEASQKAFLDTIDQELCSLNEDYDGHRAKGFGLNPPKLRLVPPGTFVSWMKSRGKYGGQHKVPRLISDRELFSGLQNFLLQNGTQDRNA
jgi:hypothetical protein